MNQKKKKEKFYSIQEIEKEFFPINVVKEKKQVRIVHNLEKKTGSKLMTDILSSDLK